jgi:hypothetical protein
MNFPTLDDPNFQAFVVGFVLPFLAATFGFTVYLVRKIISMVDNEHL